STVFEHYSEWRETISNRFCEPIKYRVNGLDLQNCLDELVFGSRRFAGLGKQIDRTRTNWVIAVTIILQQDDLEDNLPKEQVETLAEEFRPKITSGRGNDQREKSILSDVNSTPQSSTGRAPRKSKRLSQKSK
ncbi:hypothetical protein PENTCL1PPCAC_9764, partial [Pristionchus entomophagus]